MNDFILVALFFGGIAGVWWFVSSKLKAGGKGGFVRHLVGALMGLVGGFILLAIGIAILEPEPEPAAAAAQEEHSSDSVETEVVEVAESTEAAGDASEAIAVAGEADLSESDVEPVVDQWAEQRAKVEAGPDFGLTPAQFAERFNAFMRDNDMPYSISGNYEPSGQAADTFSSSLNRNMAITGSVKPDSGMMTGLIFIGQGDGSEESGALVLIGATTAFAASNSDLGFERAFKLVVDLVDEAVNVEEAERDLDGIRYSLSITDIFGSMFSASPIDLNE